MTPDLTAYYYTVWPRLRVWSGHLQHFQHLRYYARSKLLLPSFLHAATPVASLQSSRPSYLHVYTLAAGLPSSRASYPYVTTSARLQPVTMPHTSSSLHLQHASGAPEFLRQVEATPAARL